MMFTFTDGAAAHNRSRNEEGSMLQADTHGATSTMNQLVDAANKPTISKQDADATLRLAQTLPEGSHERKEAMGLWVNRIASLSGAPASPPCPKCGGVGHCVGRPGPGELYLSRQRTLARGTSPALVDLALMNLARCEITEEDMAHAYKLRDHIGQRGAEAASANAEIERLEGRYAESGSALALSGPSLEDTLHRRRELEAEKLAARLDALEVAQEGQASAGLAAETAVNERIATALESLVAMLGAGKGISVVADVHLPPRRPMAFTITTDADGSQHIQSDAGA